MLKTYYKPLEENVWQGRVDDTKNYRSFRWHQWIEPIDLRKRGEPDIPENKSMVKDFCFLGFACDEGVKRNKGRPGAAKGPYDIRQEMSNLPCSFGQEVKLYDAGNITFEEGSLEDGQKVLAQAVEEIKSRNLFPIILGGGHEIALGHYRGLQNYREKKPVGIINFDAHFDLRPYPEGGSSGTMFRQIADDCLKEGIPFSYMCLGIQRYGNTQSLFDKADELGTEYILARDIKDFNLINLLKRIDSFIKKNPCIYLTICSDVFSSAFAPGVSAAHPLGLEPEIFLTLFKHILRSEKVVGLDIAEVSPRFDPDRSTAHLAAITIFAAVNTLSGYDD